MSTRTSPGYSPTGNTRRGLSMRRGWGILGLALGMVLALLVVASAVYAADPVTLCADSLGSGQWVLGWLPGEITPRLHWAGVINVRIDGAPQPSFCAELGHFIILGSCYPDSLVYDAQPPGVACMLQHYPPVAGLADLEAAARQSAVWQFSSSFAPDAGDAVYARYDEIVTDIISKMANNQCTSTQTPNIGISPSSAVNLLVPDGAGGYLPSSHDFVITVTLDGQPVANQDVTVQTTLGSLNGSGLSVVATTGADGTATVTLSHDAPGTADLTATTTVILPVGSRVDPGTDVQDIVVPNNKPFTVEAKAQKQWKLNLGSLEVTKTVNWNGVTPDPTQTFEICISGLSYPNGDCKTADYDGATLTWDNLIPGAYTVTETDPGTSWTVQVSGSPATVPVTGGTATASVTNTRKLGSLKVTKTADWNGVTVDPTQNFSICISGPSYPTTPSCKDFNATAGWEQTWSGLIPGSYEVTEPGAGTEWNVVVTGSPANVPTNGGTATASVTNSRIVGDLQVTKSVNWNGVTEVAGQSFEICITGPSYPTTPNCQTVTDVPFVGKTLTWTGLLPGDYVVSETGATPGSLNDWTVTGSGVNVTVLGNGATGKTTISNARKLGSLQVTKTVNWNGVTPDTGQTFSICITGPSYPTTADCKTTNYDGGTLTWNDLLPGSYSVTEPGVGTEWDVVVTGSPATVPTNGGTATASIANTHKLGALQVTKVVNWGDSTPDTEQTFEICISGPSYPTTPDCKTAGYQGGVLAWSGLIPGAYTVAETEPGGWIVDGSGVTVTVPAGGQASATITNTPRAPAPKEPLLALDKAVVTNLITTTQRIVVDGIVTFTTRITNTGPTTMTIVPLNDVFTGPIHFQGGSPTPDSVTNKPSGGGKLHWNNLLPTGTKMPPTASLVVTTAFKLLTTDNAFTMTNYAQTKDAKDEDDQTPPPVDDEVELINVPTAVDLLYFRATPEGGAVVLEWATAVEWDNYQFCVLRSATGNLADAVQVVCVPGQGHGTASGATYIHTDTAVEAGQSYTYWLVDVDYDGVETIHPTDDDAAVTVQADDIKLFLPVVAR